MKSIFWKSVPVVFAAFVIFQIAQAVYARVLFSRGTAASLPAASAPMQFKATTDTQQLYVDYSTNQQQVAFQNRSVGFKQIRSTLTPTNTNAFFMDVMATGNTAAIRLKSRGSATTDGGLLQLFRSNGAFFPSAGQRYGAIVFGSYSGNTSVSTAAVHALATTKVTTTAPTSRISIETAGTNGTQRKGIIVTENAYIKYSAAGAATTGSGTALLGSNSPAATLSAPYKWIKFELPDGSLGYIPVWK